MKLERCSHELTFITHQEGILRGKETGTGKLYEIETGGNYSSNKKVDRLGG